MKKLITFMVASSLIGASTLSIEVANFQLSLFRIIILILFTITIIKFFNDNSMREKIKLIKTPQKFSIIFIIIWISYSIMSLIWVQDYNLWIKDVFFLFTFFMATILFYAYLEDVKDYLNILRIFSIVGMIHVVIGWYEYIFQKNLFIVNEYYAYRVIEKLPVSIFINTNNFATFLMFLIFVLWINFKTSSFFISKYFYFISLICSLLLMIITNSRANILGTILGLIIILLFSLFKTKSELNTRVASYIYFAALVFSLITLYFHQKVLKVIDSMFSESFKFEINNAQLNSEAIRSNLLKNGWEFLVSTWGFGTGSGNIDYWMKYKSTFDTNGIYNIHNWWMEIMVSYGVVIFVLYLLFYFNIYFDIKKSIKYSSTYQKHISIGLLAILSGFIIGSISSSSNMTSEWLWVFWGLVISYQGLKDKDEVYKE